jgi:GTPase
MFLDEHKLMVRGGNGGDGSVHFARRKYQPFGGPDGGDGGDGGHVILQATRDVDSLNHLATFKAKASHGQPGGVNLLIGARGESCYIPVPPGTLAYFERTEEEAGAVLNEGDELLVAKGGKGGKGNPHYATGSRRAPQLAQPGTPGEEQNLVLRYRIFAGTALIEPALLDHGELLPHLLAKPRADVDWQVYLRKPRWVRVEHEYQRYDVAYLPLLGDDAASLEAEFLAHLYWAENALINLVPYEDYAVEIADALLERLLDLPLRRLTSVAVAATVPLSAPRQFKTEAGVCHVNCAVVGSEEDISGLLASQLAGGIVG